MGGAEKRCRRRKLHNGIAFLFHIQFGTNQIESRKSKSGAEDSKE